MFLAYDSHQFYDIVNIDVYHFFTHWTLDLEENSVGLKKLTCQTRMTVMQLFKHCKLGHDWKTAPRMLKKG
jgi:hypothetical protein